MLKIDTLNLEIDAKITISDECVERCLKLIEFWLNDNPNKRIRGGYRSDGVVMPFSIEEVVEGE